MPSENLNFEWIVVAPQNAKSCTQGNQYIPIFPRPEIYNPQGFTKGEEELTGEFLIP